MFPVADGDTGDNMALTLRAVLTSSTGSPRRATIDEIGRDEIVDSVARAALLGARGNSGVILSQLIRGAAEELISRPGELVDPVLIAAAMARAADRAYGSVRDPAEGTILTVVREMAARAASEIAHMAEPRLQHRVDDATQNEMLAYVLEHALDAGQAVGQARARAAAGPARGRRRGRRRLRPDDHLRRRGRRAARRRAAAARAPRAGAHHPPAARVLDLPLLHELRRHRRGPRAPAPWIARLEALGDSVLVVGDAHTLKVHVHTDEPERATALFDGVGAVSRLDVADMHEQVAAAHARLRRGDPGHLRRARGRQRRRHARAVRGLGAHVLDGGATLNPSTYELLAGIHEVPAEEVVVLPELAQRPHGRRARRRAVGEDRRASCRRARWRPGWPPRSRSTPPAAPPPTRRDGGDAAARPHRRRHRGRPRRHAGPLPPRRLRRLHRRGARRLGRAPGRTARGARQLGREAELITCLRGAQAPLDDGRIEGAGRGRG